MKLPDLSATRTLVAATAALSLAAVLAGPVAAEDETVSAALVEGTITLYTSVTEDTVDAVLAALAETHPDLAVEVFRVPSGELDARIAAELRSGGIGADVLWMTDPLSVQQYEADGLLALLGSEALDVVPDEYRGETFVGTRLLNLVIAAGSDLGQVPVSWADLADPAYAGRIAIPDPGFAGSAFAALGYFATAPEYGMDFYQQLKDNGAVQVSSPVDVLTGVAEGRYDAGITLDKIVRDNVAKGSPVELIWPEPGAIAVFSPAAVVATSDEPDTAAAFVDFLVSPAGQAAIASTGWQPVRSDVEWEYAAPVVAPDWGELFGRQGELLEGYRAIFGD